MVIAMDKIEVIRCSSCGSTDIENIGGNMGKCSHCGSTMILPKKQGEIISLLNNAYIYRANFNYDLAIKSYQFILEKDSNELAAYEGILLSEYGIEYVKDSYTGKMIPTCHRAHFTSIYDNEYYKTLITLANDEQRIVIEEKVKEIDKLQKAIERQLKNEQEYDIFISYKATDNNGDKTEDALIARELFDELSKKNYKVFFAEKSLEDRIGAEYEPIIFKALHTSKIFILIGTSKENIESNWVRNEWSRYIDRIKNEEGLTKNSFIPVFKDMNPYDMPKVNNSYVQGVDASKLGYITTLIDGIGKILKPEKEQKVLETFENLDNFDAFTKLQKQKKIELKNRNWKEFVQTKGIKKWLYYIFIFAPSVISLIYLALCIYPESHYARGKTFTAFHVFFSIEVIISVIVLCVHSRKFRVNKLVNLIFPFSSMIVGLILYLTIYLCVPVTICGQTARDLGMNMYKDDGFYYYSTNVLWGNEEIYGIAALDINEQYEKYVKIQNGKKILFIPDNINGLKIGYFEAEIPSDIQILVLPKTISEYTYTLTVSAENVPQLEEIYCYDVDDINLLLRGSYSYDDLSFKICSKNESNMINAYPHIILKDGGYYD